MVAVKDFISETRGISVFMAHFEMAHGSMLFYDLHIYFSFPFCLLILATLGLELRVWHVQRRYSSPVLHPQTPTEQFCVDVIRRSLDLHFHRR